MGFKHYWRDEGLVRAGKFLGKYLSLRCIRRLAKFVAGVMNLVPNLSLRQVLAENLKMVLKDKADQKTIKRMSKVAIQNLMHMHADYFYYYMHPEEGKAAVKFSQKARETIEDVKERHIPTVCLGPHLGNFDLFGLSFAWEDVPMMVLSVPNPEGVYNEQNQMRRDSGINVQPIDMRSMRDAKKFLLGGGCIVTGIDRPVEEPDKAKYKPLFYGVPAAVPVFYTRYGLEPGVRMRVGSCVLQPDGTYLVDCSDPIPMLQYDDLQELYELNAQAVLKETERMISKDPDQWMMLHPVWQENDIQATIESES